jgi:hypothetical protein
MSYYVGDLVRISATWTNAAGSVTDPTAVLAKYRDPAGTVTTYTYGTDTELVKDSTGIYHVDIDADSAGKWLYRFYSTGPGQASSSIGEFIVFVSEFP